MPTPSQAAASAKLLSLAKAALGTIQPAEARLLQGAATAEDVIFGSDPPWVAEDDHVDRGPGRWSAEREVRAEVIRWLWVDKSASALVDPHGIRLRGARILGMLDLAQAEIPFPLEFTGCRLADTCRFVGCQIGRLKLEGSWTAEIAADGANIKQSLYLNHGFRADGPVSLVMTQIGATLVCEGGTFWNPGGDALSADGLNVTGDVALRADVVAPEKLRAFRAKGRVSLIGAKIGGDLDCTGGEFSNPDDAALVMQRASVGGGLLLASAADGETTLPFQCDGQLDLQAATANLLANPKACWPAAGNLKLSGFSYSVLDDSSGAAEEQLDWLRLETSTPAPTQPYSKLAKVLLDAGDSDGSTLVQQAKERLLTKSRLLRMLKWSIGYGYKPGNAIWGLIALTLLGAFILWRNEGSIVLTMPPAHMPATHAHYPAFQPFIYSLENTFPLVKLGQTEVWQPDAEAPGLDFLRWFVWVQQILGWVLTSLFAAAVSGIVQHGE